MFSRNKTIGQRLMAALLALVMVLTMVGVPVEKVEAAPGDPQVVTADVADDINTTVNLFNYDASFNTNVSLARNLVFPFAEAVGWSGKTNPNLNDDYKVFSGDLGNPYRFEVLNSPSVDGGSLTYFPDVDQYLAEGYQLDEGAFSFEAKEPPTMNKYLASAKGMSTETGTNAWNEKYDKAYPTYLYAGNASQPVSMDDYFSAELIEGSKNPYHEATMNNGGKLFRYGNPKDDINQGEFEGYYFYDSKENAAVYDENSNSFKLYDTVVRPKHIDEIAEKVNDYFYNDIPQSNFLPFNKIYDAQGNLLVEMDSKSQLESGIKTAEINGEVTPLDMWFGLTAEFDFYMPEDGMMVIEDKDGNKISKEMIFDFFGDDDVYVYVDNVLVLNLGGIHSAHGGTINFATGDVSMDAKEEGSTQKINTTLEDLFREVGNTETEFVEGKFKDYSVHNLKFYYLERGSNISYCRLKFNMPTLPKNSLLVEKDVTIADGATADEESFIKDTLEYQFRVMRESNDTVLLGEGTPYSILENGVKVGDGRVGKDGVFSLKHGQQAQFTEVFEAEQHVDYYVEEMLPEETTGQYGSVEYSAGDTSGEITGKNGDVTGFKFYKASNLTTDESQIVVFKNNVNIQKLGTLNITKQAASGSKFDSGETFDMQVKLAGELLPVGTKYIVGGTEKEVTTAGIIPLKVGETATLSKKILAGTEYSVTELVDDSDEYTATYAGTGYGAQVSNSGVSGKMPVEGTVNVTVTNAKEITYTSIKVSKEALGDADGKDTVYNFKATWDGGSEDNISLKDGGSTIINNIPAGVDVTVTETAVDGITTYYQIDSTTTKGNTAKVTAVEGTVKEVKFYNVGKYTEDDTVVIDYGLDVDIKVLDNDYFPSDASLALSLKDAVDGKVAGTYGKASLNDNKVKYSLNKSNGMQMNKEDKFQYNVQYDNGIANQTYSANVTVIPATSIYYEDDFVTYNSYDWDGNPIESVWDIDGTAVNKAQSEDRPGEALDDTVANKIYGYDAAYTEFAAYSNGSAMKATVSSKINEKGKVVEGKYATAEFTFTGTGFDVVSMTSDKTGTIVAKVEQEQADGSYVTVKSKIVDTYYGYNYDTTQQKWVVDPESSDSLYQIPVLKVDGLDYGTYKVTITASHRDLFDHGQYGAANDGTKKYDFYLDAIRIYDPANDGTDSETVKDAYVKDKEGWPEYHELRNQLIDDGFDFINDSGNTVVNGAVFIDGSDTKGSEVTVSEYTNYGPNNEVYLAQKQAIAFDMDYTCNKEKIQLAYKLAQGNPKIKIYTVDDNGTASNVTEADVTSATDLYHDITKLNGNTVVITNVGTGILSITNIKVTHSAECSAKAQTAGVFTMSRPSLLRALNTLRIIEPEVKQGLVKDDDGHIRYYEDGVAIYKGLVRDGEGNFYYVNSTKKAVKNCTYGIGEKKANGLLPAGTYKFDEDGKMIDPPVDKEGLTLDKDGEIRYYENNVAVYKGLVQDDEGNYYYINSTKKAVKNCKYGIGAGKANNLLPAGTYQFGADGKMIR